MALPLLSVTVVIFVSVFRGEPSFRMCWSGPSSRPLRLTSSMNGNNVGFHLLLSVEETDVLTSELVLCIVLVDCCPGCIDEQNGSVEIEDCNCLGYLFSDVCQTPQRSLDALMRGNCIVHLTGPQETTDTITIIIKSLAPICVKTSVKVSWYFPG